MNNNLENMIIMNKKNNKILKIKKIMEDSYSNYKFPHANFSI